jgi:hypothetical protein
MPLISVTRIRIRSIWLMPKFIWFSIKSLKQARKSNGIIEARVFNDARLTYWTCSIWESKEQMLGYMKSGAHKKAMPHLQHWCNEARTGHTIIEGSAFPSALEIKNILLEHGRPSKVNQPTEDHLKGIFPDPVFKVK